MVGVKKVTLPVYLKPGPAPAAVFRAESLHKDYQRRGFFRIGALPMLAVEDASIEILDLPGITNALSRITDHLKRKKAEGAVELRRARLFFPSEPQPVLTARKIRLVDGVRWELSEATLSTGTNELKIAHGMLAVLGEDAGRVRWMSASGPAEFRLFSVCSNNTTTEPVKGKPPHE